VNVNDGNRDRERYEEVWRVEKGYAGVCLDGVVEICWDSVVEICMARVMRNGKRKLGRGMRRGSWEGGDIGMSDIGMSDFLSWE
jgi:hypothetical protein